MIFKVLPLANAKYFLYNKVISIERHSEYPRGKEL